MIQAFSEVNYNGSQSATVVFYEGVQPTSTADAVDSNNILVTLVFPSCVLRKRRLPMLSSSNRYR